MAISTYGELQTAIASWLVRSDLTSVIPDFVALCEADLRRDLRCSAMETLTNGTLTGESLAWPTGYLEAKRLTIGGDPYEFVTAEQYGYASANQSQMPIFTHIGQSIYVLNGSSGDAYTLLYFKALTAFSGSSDTNWLLTNHPGIYLWGSLKHGADYLRDDASVAKYQAMYQGAVKQLNSAEHRAQHSGSPLTVRAG